MRRFDRIVLCVLTAGVCTIAAQKRHFALYICNPALVDDFRDRLGAVDCGKGCLRFKTIEALPLDVVEDLVKRAAQDPGWAH